MLYLNIPDWICSIDSVAFNFNKCCIWIDDEGTNQNNPTI